MSASFFLAHCRFPHLEVFQAEPWTIELWNRVSVAGLRRVDAFRYDLLNDEALDAAAMDLRVHPTPLDPTPREMLIDAIKTEMKRGIAMLTPREDTLSNGIQVLRFRQDVGWLEIDGARYWVTGGLSHGDEPTDSFPWIEALGEFGIFDAPITEAELAA